MGIQSYRNIKYFAYINMVICICADAVFLMNMFGYKFISLESISLKEVNLFTGFIFIAAVIGMIGVVINKTPGLTCDDNSKIESKMMIYKLMNIVFIGYIVICGIFIRDKNLLISSCILEGTYFCSIAFTRKMYELMLTDHQLKWQKAMYGDDDLNDSFGYSSILWRYKIWFTPFEKVPFNRRYLSKNIVFTTIIIAILFYKDLFETFTKDLILLPLIIIWLKQFLCIIEYIFGLYTSISGMCTGVEELTDSNIQTRSDEYVYYRVYVTDFKHKRELVFQTYDCMTMYKNENITVIHGIFSKKPIMVNSVKIRFR